MRPDPQSDIRSGFVPGSMLPGHEDRLVSADTSTHNVPEDVFCYSRPDLWQDRLWELMGDHLTEGVKSAFLADLPEFVVSDDLSWLDDVIEEVTGKRPDIKMETADRLMGEYRAFRMYHATRTNDLSSYYQGGLRFLSNLDIEDRARSFFMNGTYSHVTEKTLSDAIQDLNGGSFTYRTDETPLTYCCADSQDFTTRSGGCGHYLDFGSEYLYNLGIRMIGSHRTQEVLRGHGSPTIFVIDVPMGLVRQSTVTEFAGNLLEYMFCSLSDDLEAYSLSPGSGSGIILRDAIPAEAVIGHFHPAKFFHNLT